MAKTDLNKCKVFLLYHGSLVFEDSRRVTVTEYTECRCLYSQLDKYYKKLEKDSEKQKEKEQQKQRAIRQSRNHIPSDSESESTESSDGNIMPSTSMTVDTSKEKESNMPSENNSDTPEGAHAAAADVDLEKMMEDGNTDGSNQAKDNSKQSSSSRSSDSGSSSSEEETSSEDTEYICATATCGEVYQSATALRAHERKHSLKCRRNGQIPCDYPWCGKDYGTKRALQCHKKNVHDNPGKRFYCTDRLSKGKDCTKSYPTQQQLEQHVREIHGPGFISYCGDRFTWPLDRHNHQKECMKCKHLLN